MLSAYPGAAVLGLAWNLLELNLGRREPSPDSTTSSSLGSCTMMVFLKFVGRHITHDSAFTQNVAAASVSGSLAVSTHGMHAWVQVVSVRTAHTYSPANITHHLYAAAASLASLSATRLTHRRNSGCRQPRPLGGSSTRPASRWATDSLLRALQRAASDSLIVLTHSLAGLLIPGARRTAGALHARLPALPVLAPCGLRKKGDTP